MPIWKGEVLREAGRRDKAGKGATELRKWRQDRRGKGRGQRWTRGTAQQQCAFVVNGAGDTFGPSGPEGRDLLLPRPARGARKVRGKGRPNVAGSPGRDGEMAWDWSAGQARSGTLGRSFRAVGNGTRGATICSCAGWTSERGVWKGGLRREGSSYASREVHGEGVCFRAGW